jgi:hypothetical protein
MAYKQDRNPGKINYGPSGYRDPKKTTKNYNALEFNMPDLSNIVDSKADGEQVTEDKSNKSGSNEEGVIPKGENVKGQNDKTLEKAKNAQRVQDFINEGNSLKKERQKGRQTKRGINKAIRQFKRDDRKRGLDEERTEMLDAAIKERDRLREAGQDFKDKKAEDKMIEKGNRRTDKEIEKANKPKNRIKRAQAEFDKKQKDKFGIVDGTIQETKPGIDQTAFDYEQMAEDEKWGYGVHMHKQKDMRPKNLFKQGKNMPNIDSEETRPAMYNQGRPMNSGVLENNPNIVQPDNKVAFSTQQRNDKFSNIASSGMPDQTADGMGQVNPANTPNKPMGGLDQTFSQSQMAMYGMPMYDAPAKALVGDQASLPDHLKDAIEDAPASHYHVSKGKYANDTRVNKSNYKAAERDNAAHIEYLKKDIDYDSKHNKSDIDMTADEKHISKLAGDMKYDKEKHGDGPSYGRHGAAWDKKKNTGTTKRGASVSITTQKRMLGDNAMKEGQMENNEVGKMDHPKGDFGQRKRAETPNTVTYSKTNKKGKTKTKTVKGSTRASKRLHNKFNRQTRKGTRGKAEYDQPGSFKGLVGKLKKEGKSETAATKIAGKIAQIKKRGGGSGPTAKQRARMGK